MTISEIVSLLGKRSDCEVSDSKGLPDEKQLNGYALTNELKEFYSICGGLEITPSEACGTTYGTIAAPNEFLQADPIVASEDAVELWKSDGTYDTLESKSCFTFMDIGNGNYIVVDLGEENNGKVYLADWEDYPIYGDVPIIANSILEFLTLILKGLENSDDFYWEQDDFTPFGVAFE